MRLEQEKTITALLTNDPALQPLEGELLRAHALLREAFSGGGKLLVCGNGGSAADSAHVVGELMKGFRKRRPLPAKEAEAVQAVRGILLMPVIQKIIVQQCPSHK